MDGGYVGYVIKYRVGFPLRYAHSGDWLLVSPKRHRRNCSLAPGALLLRPLICLHRLGGPSAALRDPHFLGTHGAAHLLDDADLSDDHLGCTHGGSGGRTPFWLSHFLKGGLSLLDCAHDREATNWFRHFLNRALRYPLLASGKCRHEERKRSLH